MTDIFEESFYDGDDFKGMTGKNVKHVKNGRVVNSPRRINKIVRPHAPHGIRFDDLVKTDGHISKRRSPLIVSRNGSLMVPPSVWDEQSAPNSYDGVRNSEFSDFGGRLDYSESIESEAYDDLNDPMNYCDNEPDNFFFGLIGNKKKMAEKKLARAEKALSKGKTKKANRLMSKANKVLQKIDAGNQALNTTQQLQAKIEQDRATASANDAALSQIKSLAGSGGTASDSLRAIQESLATSPGQLSPSQAASFPSGNTDMSPLQAGGGGGGGAMPSEDSESGGTKTLAGVTVTSDKPGMNKWLLIGGGVLAVIIVMFFILKKKK